ncbi:MAG TPA: ArsA-related P-loop ATPase [Acidimicrobiales bacterium]|nr:ArsA-related P-loop ATPase [Acidimicrobiales bacterium]
MSEGLVPLVTERTIVVCCGSGGVGKTTVSAAFGVEAARRGRRTCVVTIDPAKRLADALGLEALGNTPHRVAGDWSGELWALMLDPKGTFDDLVHRYAGSPEQAEGILANRLYRNLTGALSGTQEYMAMEKLYELSESGDFDLVIVDTPPTRNALDFLDAPRRLTRFLGHRLFQVLLMPTRAYLRAVSVATQALLRTLSKVAGAEIVQDAVTFFRAFEGMEEGFRTRAEHMRELVARPTTAFVLVTSPRTDTVEEAGWFAAKLEESQLEVEGLVVNRVHPAFGPGGGGGRPAVLAVPAVPSGPEGRALAALVTNLAEFQALNTREEAAFARLVARVAPAPVARVPLLDIDVHDVEGLAVVAGHIFGPAPSLVGAEGPGLA